MSTLDTVARLVAELPETEERDRRGQRTWVVREKVLAWERTFSKADIKRYGDEPVPAYPILAIRTADLEEKDAVLGEGLPGVFTISHFDGFSAILVELTLVTVRPLRRLLLDGYLAVAPPDLTKAYER